MRIALFSDIHGNLTGLQAVLQKLKAVGGADLTIAAGDLIAGDSGTDEILNLLLDRDVRMLRGDSDTREKLENLIAGEHPSSPRYPKAYYQAMLGWLEDNLSPEGWDLLENLPTSIQIETAPGHKFYACHAAPEDPSSRTCIPDLPPEMLRTVFDPIEAEVIAFGHAHTPHVRWLDGRIFINVASVAFRPDATSMLTLLTCLDGPSASARSGKANWTIEQLQVPFDPALEHKRMRQKKVPLPEDY